MKLKLLLALLFITLNAFSQKKQNVFTSDIDNFWNAYDDIQNEVDYSKKLKIINNLYVSKGTEGLKLFMYKRNFNDSTLVDVINKYPKFWNSIRPNTLIIKNKIPVIKKAIKKLKKLYPELTETRIYFTIGATKSGGTIVGNNLLMGTEKIVGDLNTNTSEFEEQSLKNMFQKTNPNLIDHVTIHEYIHTQQKGDPTNVLSKSIKEGSCDFIAELILNKKFNSNYIEYGNENHETVKNNFKIEMFTQNYNNWLYNSGKEEKADLGYFVGYEISKLFYNNSKNKKQAIKDIVELKFDNEIEVEAFLKKSNYFSENINKEILLKQFKENQPYVIKIEPFSNEQMNVDSELKQIKISFSKPMSEKISISISKNGKEHFPLKRIIGLENNNQTLVLETSLKPNTEYDFSITNKGTKSIDGFPFREEVYNIKFKTK
jgi:hypothetical protein